LKVFMGFNVEKILARRAAIADSDSEEYARRHLFNYIL
jgi:hypothetical protein